MSPHLPASALDLMLLGSLPAAERASAEAHLAGCARCQGQWAALQEGAAQFNQFVLPRTQAAVRARVERPRAGAWLRRGLAPALGLAAACALALGVVRSRAVAPAAAPYTGTKGAPIFQIYGQVAPGQAPVKLAPDGQVSTGERLRFEVEPAGYAYALVVSVDGLGHVQAFYPPEGTRSAAVSPGTHVLPGAIELDDAPGVERIYAYFSRTPISLDALAKPLHADPTAPPVLEGAAPPQVFTLTKPGK